MREEVLGQKENWIVDVSETDFEREVLEASATRTVVVDFWAPWCGPCRALAPILESLAAEMAGDFLLARVNIDEAQQVARLFGITSIPAVTAFQGGRAVAEFVGAQPEAEVRLFLEKLLPTEADRHASAGAVAWAADDLSVAERAYRAALALDPHHRVAEVGLARCCGAKGEVDTALELLARWVPGDPEAEQLAAELRLRQVPESAQDASALERLRAQIDADPDAHQARLDWARNEAAQGRTERALETLLESVARDPHWNEDAARQVMLDLFASLGADHELTQRFRAALARVLFR